MIRIYYINIKRLQNKKMFEGASLRATEMAQQLEAIAVLTEDLGSPHPCGGSQPFVTPGDLKCSSDLQRHCVYKMHRQQNIQRHKIKQIFRKIMLICQKQIENLILKRKH